MVLSPPARVRSAPPVHTNPMHHIGCSLVIHQSSEQIAFVPSKYIEVPPDLAKGSCNHPKPKILFGDFVCFVLTLFWPGYWPEASETHERFTRSCVSNPNTFFWAHDLARMWETNSTLRLDPTNRTGHCKTATVAFYVSLPRPSAVIQPSLGFHF